MDNITPELVLLFTYLNQNGGSEVVKKATMDFYCWFKSVLSKPSQQKKIEGLKEKPQDKEAQKQLASAISDAKEDGEIAVGDIQARLKDLMELLKKEDHGAYTKGQTTIKQNIQTITGSGNIGIQDVSDSSININK